MKEMMPDDESSLNGEDEEEEENIDNYYKYKDS